MSAGKTLNERQIFTLRWLAENSDTAPDPEAAGWRVPDRTTYAWKLGDALIKAELAVNKRHSNFNAARGASNTLGALRKRGLVANDGGGVFIQNRWWLTPAGEAALETAT
jgi:hypothetical protein